MGKSQCTMHTEGVLPGLHIVLHQNNPKQTQRKHQEKEKVGGREVEMGVKVSEELIHCKITAKLYSHPAANTNKHEFFLRIYVKRKSEKPKKQYTPFVDLRATSDHL